MSAIDLDAYFERIGYAGPRAATPETLREIATLHPRAIPFENLDPFLGRPVALDLASLEKKIVRGRRGGYCFEQNTLLRSVLEALRFRVRGLGARVLWSAPEDAGIPRTHMLLAVDAGGETWLVDVAFGSQTPAAPLRFEPGLVQRASHEACRLRRFGDDYRIEAFVGGSWRPLYRFGLEEHLPADYEVWSWYTSTHPRSHFVNELIATRVVPDGRWTLRDRELKRHFTDGRTERRSIGDAAELTGVLARIFGIDTPPGAGPAFERLFQDGHGRPFGVESSGSRIPFAAPVGLESASGGARHDPIGEERLRRNTPKSQRESPLEARRGRCSRADTNEQTAAWSQGNAKDAGTSPRSRNGSASSAPVV